MLAMIPLLFQRTAPFRPHVIECRGGACPTRARDGKPSPYGERRALSRTGLSREKLALSLSKGGNDCGLCYHFHDRHLEEPLVLGIVTHAL